MLQGGVVMRYQGDDEWFLPKVYHNGAWQYCLPYVFSSNIWKLAGAAGVPMIRFVLETDGDLIVYGDDIFFKNEIWAESSKVLFAFVKETIDAISLLDKFKVSTTLFLTVPKTVFLEPNFIPITSGISVGI